MKRLFFTLMVVMSCLSVWADNSVSVVYNGTTATVIVDENVAPYLTVTQSGAHVSIVQSSEVTEEITYTLTGTSTNGEFYMEGSFKATIQLNGLTLTNTTPVYSGAAVHIQNGKRINVKVITGTTNTLTDAANGSQKGCLYVKGHAEFKQYGTLNIVGNASHGIKAGEYISVKNATINVTSAVDDGISCNQYFLMESGSVSISGTGDDGIQCDLDGETSTGMTTNHEDEDSGNMYFSGGSITINCPAIAAKGIKSVGDIYVSDNAVINVTTTGKGKWDTTDLEAKAACGMDSDGNITISGGTLTLTATGSGGKGMKCSNVLTITGGDITVSTSGGLYYNNGSNENTNYTGNVEQLTDSYYCSPKGVKAGTKGNSIIGGIDISGGRISVTTTGNNAEGIESKNYVNISGGEVFVDAHDDGINSALDLTISGGYVYSRGSNNDGIDANGDVFIQGGLIYAIGASSPEVAVDANSEENKKFYFSGGTLIAIGGLERGSDLQQSCYQASTWSSNTWYSMTFGNTVIAFKTPSSGGTPLVVSAESTPTLKSGVTVSGGTSIFNDRCYLDATVNGGSTVTLSQYTSGGGGNPPGPGGNTYTISATASPSAGGSVSGAGSYPRNATCTLVATANTGYTFSRWTRNGQQVSTNPTYSFQVMGNASYVANFTQNTYTVTATANPTDGGTITGAGTYYHGASVNLRAIANEGYNFVNWTENGTAVSTQPNYTFVITANKNLVANFEENHPEGPYVTLDSYMPTMALVGEDTDLTITFKNVGTAATSDTTIVTLTSSNTNVNIMEGTSGFGVLDADATTTVSGFLFSLNSGVALGSNVTLHYTAVSGDNTWEGNFTITPNQVFTVTVAANNAEYGTVSGGGQFNYGESCTVTATPMDGYMFSNWTRNGNVVSSNVEYTFNVTNDMDLVANFAEGVMIGDNGGTTTNQYLPSYNYYKQGLSEQIYTSAELGGAGLITSIAFFNGGAEKTRTYDFYMKATTKNTFSSKTDWIAVSSVDKVFSGSVTMVANDWTTITFSAPFVYDGTSNVILVTDDNTGSYTSSPHMACRVFNASNQAIYAYDDSYNFNPLSPSSSSVTGNAILSVKNQLIITKEAFSTEPVNITVSIEPAQAGTVSGGGEVPFGEICTVVVTPNTDYTFIGWTENGTLVTSDLTYSFTAVADRNLVATFIHAIEIGEATTTNNYLPTYAYYNYSLTQQIYTAEEIGTAGTITSIAFYNEGVERTRTCDFYLMTTDKSSFTSKTDWITVADSDKVFSGSITLTANAWTFITFDTPFEYDGTSNLVLVSDDNTGSYQSTMACSVFNTSSTQAIYYWDDNINFNPLSPPTSSGSAGWGETPNDVLSVKNHILLGIEVIEPQTQQTIALAEGWNWISTNLEVTLDDLKTALVEALPGTAITIKSKDNSITYNGTQWRGTLKNMDVTRMYMVKTAAACEIILTGTPIIPADNPVAINSGVNWIGFPLTESMSLANAFAGFAVNGDMVKSKDLSSNYANGKWRGTLNTLEPGKGYIYKSNVSSDRVFTFPTSLK